MDYLIRFNVRDRDGYFWTTNGQFERSDDFAIDYRDFDEAEEDAIKSGGFVEQYRTVAASSPKLFLAAAE